MELGKELYELEVTRSTSSARGGDKQKGYLSSKAKDLAKVMNDFFIPKVQKIVQDPRKLPVNLTACENIMEFKNSSMHLQFV